MSSPKLVKKVGQEPTALENSIAAALTDLENSSPELKVDLRDLYFVSAKEFELDSHSKKVAVVIFVPFPQRKAFQKVQSRLIRELEKKFSGKHFLIVAQRTIFSVAYKRKNSGAIRPRSRTLTTVHEGILQDLVYPTEIVGKRTRVRVDGSKLLKIFLNPKDQRDIDNKVATFTAVYKRLTNKNCEFLFPTKA